MQIKVNNEEKLIMCNLLRHMSLTHRKVLRPIGFRVGTASNLLTSSQTVEDMLTFYSALTALAYEYNGESDLVVMKIQLIDKLNVSDLNQQGVKVRSNQACLLHALSNTPTEVEIYFRFTEGNQTQEDNTQFLKEHNYDVFERHISVFASRHCDIVKFSWDNDRNDLADAINIDIETNSGADSKTVLVESIENGIAVLQKIKENLI